MGEPILKVTNLIAAYGPVVVIKGIDFNAYEGEIVGLVGPNGAGKTTFLEALAGSIEIREGKIHLLGKRIDGLPVMKRRKMGMLLMPQEDYIFPFMPVKRNLQVAGLFNSNEKNKELLDFVYGLFPVLKARERQIANTLSGGERKMLSVGMGIMADARVLLIDEPSIGLAPKIVSALFENLKTIKEETRKTLILSEQNVKILNIADRIFGLEAGEIRFCENTEDLDEMMVKELYMGE
ncbi:MAG: ABC transporter ATP-binding protein [Deltaproteobacteria bacterium]|nr:ABC transporter ATP-binding protein [Deltaproteobacteria bacterium]